MTSRSYNRTKLFINSFVMIMSPLTDGVTENRKWKEKYFKPRNGF